MQPNVSDTLFAKAKELVARNLPCGLDESCRPVRPPFEQMTTVDAEFSHERLLRDYEKVLVPLWELHPNARLLKIAINCLLNAFLCERERHEYLWETFFWICVYEEYNWRYLACNKVEEWSPNTPEAAARTQARRNATQYSDGVFRYGEPKHLGFYNWLCLPEGEK